MMNTLRSQTAQPNVGIVEISIGPTIVIDPLMTHAQLRDKLNKVCVESHYFNGESFPISDHYRASGITDGIYDYNQFAKMFSESAGAIDIFGNLAHRTRLLREQTFQGPGFSDEVRARIPCVADKMVGIEAAAVVERVLCGVEAARRYFSLTGFVGIATLSLGFPNASGFPLTFNTGRWSTILGFCAPENEISIQATFSTTDLIESFPAALGDLVLRLLWSWGCMKSEMVAKVIDLAEQYHYGRNMCECRQWHYPLNRSQCLSCHTR